MGGDPVNFSDPLGLKASVNCRAVKVPKQASHCAIRVVDKAKNIDVTIEMMPDERKSARAPLGRERVEWSTTRPPGTYDGDWTPLPVPSGVTESQFDRAILESAVREQQRIEGSVYTPGGGSNSNRFIYDVIRGAGGVGVRNPSEKHLLGAPGLCGGRGLSTGTDCK